MSGGGIPSVPGWGPRKWLTPGQNVPTTVPVPIAEGGTGQTTATTAFNALSPQTTRGDLITRDATNDVRLAVGTANQVLRSDGTDPSWGTVAIAGGGTGQTTQTAAFNALSPQTTRGDLITRDATNDVRLAVGTANQVLTSNGTDPSWGTAAIAGGGTGQTTATAAFNALSPQTTRGDLITRDASNDIRLAIGSNGRLLGSNGTDPSWVPGLTTRGDLLTRDASAYTRLAVGSTGQFLASDGTDPLWRSMAVQADQEAGTSIINPVVPGVQQFHPSAAKWWASVSVSGGTPTLDASNNVTSITDSGVGDLTVTIATDFSSASWCPFLTSKQSDLLSGGLSNHLAVLTIAAGSVEFGRTNTTPAAADPQAWYVGGFGDQ